MLIRTGPYLCCKQTHVPGNKQGGGCQRVIGTHVGRVSYMPPLNARQQQHVLLHIPKKGGDTEGVFRTDSKEKVHLVDTCCSVLVIEYQDNLEQSHCEQSVTGGTWQQIRQSNYEDAGDWAGHDKL
jgi:hypothetical protein